MRMKCPLQCVPSMEGPYCLYDNHKVRSKKIYVNTSFLTAQRQLASERNTSKVGIIIIVVSSLYSELRRKMPCTAAWHKMNTEIDR